MASKIRSFWFDFYRRGLSSIDSIFSSQFFLKNLNGVRLSPRDFGGIINTPNRLKLAGSFSSMTDVYSLHIFSDGSGTPVISAFLGSANAGGVHVGEVEIGDISPGETSRPTSSPATQTIAVGIGDVGGVSIVPWDDYFYIFRGVGSPGNIKVEKDLYPVVTAAIGSPRPDFSNASISASEVADEDNNVVGTVKYYISQVTLDVEGALSTAFDTDGVDTKDGMQVDITFDHADYYNNTYRIYRTSANGFQPQYIGTVDVAAATPGTTFTDNVLDIDLGNVPREHGDPPPADLHTVIVAYGRLFGCNETTLYWSDVNYPESWFTNEFGNNLRIVDGDSDKVCLITQDDLSFVIFTERNIYRLFGRIPEEFELKPIERTPGLSVGLGFRDGTNDSQNKVISTDHGLVFRSPKGVFLLSGENVVELTKDIRDLLFSGDFGTKPGIGYDPQMDELFCTFVLADGVSVQTYIYSFRLRQWVGHIDEEYDCFFTFEGLLYGLHVEGTTAEIELLSFFGVTGDINTDAVWEAGELTLPTFYSSTPFALKRFIAFNLLFDDTYTGDFEVEVTIDDETPETISLLAPHVSPIRFPLGELGRYISVVVRQPGAGPFAPWKIYGAGFEFQHLGDSKKFGAGVSGQTTVISEPPAQGPR